MIDPGDNNGWEAYYRAIQGRTARPLFIDALTRFELDNFDPALGLAIDLGCGDGTETLALLDKGWNVFAIDQRPEAIERVQSQVLPDQQTRLQTQIVAFQNVVLPVADFLYAGLSLPFCTPEHFASVWSKIVVSIRPRGRFAGHFFGVRDGWASRSTMTFYTEVEIQRLFADFDVEFQKEIDEVRPTRLEGPKHWHIFEVIARKR